MEFKDYYKILGVDKKADNAEIKKAYRKLAQKYHPDKTKGDPEAEKKFKEVNEAYHVLTDPEKRQKYDNLGSSYNNFRQSGGREGDFQWEDWFSGRPGGARRSTGERFRTVGDIFDSGGLSDFFEKIFGGSFGGAGTKTGYRQKRGYRHPPSRGEDQEAEIEISLEEAFRGTTKRLSVNGQAIDLKIKPGINTGQTLRLKGKGTPGKSGGQSGDLMIKVNVKDHPKVERKGDDLYVPVRIDLFKAVLGGSASINTFGGKLKINIPPESQPGKKLKLKGQGMPNYSNPDIRGDLYIELEVELPQNLSKEEKKQFEKLRDLRHRLN